MEWFDMPARVPSPSPSVPSAPSVIHVESKVAHQGCAPADCESLLNNVVGSLDAVVQQSQDQLWRRLNDRMARQDDLLRSLLGKCMLKKEVVPELFSGCVLSNVTQDLCEVGVPKDGVNGSRQATKTPSDCSDVKMEDLTLPGAVQDSARALVANRAANTPPLSPSRTPSKCTVDSVVPTGVPPGMLGTEVLAKKGEAHWGASRPPLAKGHTMKTSNNNQWNKKIKKSVTKIQPKHLAKNDVLTDYSKQKVAASQTVIMRLVGSERYELFSSTLIITNCIFIAVQLEYITIMAERTGRDVDKPHWSFILEVIFCALFLAELLLRVSAHGVGMFFKSRNHDWAWNLFDLVVVAAGIVEIALELASGGEGNPGNASILRSMRALRTTRAIRAIRVLRFFRELRMIICSIMGSFHSLMWSMAMMLLFWYIFGIILTTGVYQQCVIDAVSDTDAGCIVLQKRYGTLGRSVLTLYQSMSGGVDWGDVYEEMKPIPFFYKIMFLFYLFFTVFGVVNIVTGIFVESAMAASQGDRDILVKVQMQQQQKYLKDMLRLFNEIDTDRSGKIVYEEFERHLNDERALAYFEAMKLDISEVDMLFNLIDTDQSGSVDIEEFITGCQRLKGESRALDMAILHYEFESWMKQFTTFAELTEYQFVALNAQVAALLEAKGLQAAQLVYQPTPGTTPLSSMQRAAARRASAGKQLAKTRSLELDRVLQEDF